MAYNLQVLLLIYIVYYICSAIRLTLSAYRYCEARVSMRFTQNQQTAQLTSVSIILNVLVKQFFAYVNDFKPRSRGN